MEKNAKPEILYVDNHLLVVVKPPMLPVQADASGDEDLLSLLKAYIKEKYDKPGAVYLGLVHRLDRPVGGVMVFARTSKAAGRLCAQFQGRGVEKRYAALVTGTPRPHAMLSDFILRGEDNGSRLCSSDTPGAKSARLHYQRIGEAQGLSLLDIELGTGRHHQIRAQLSGHGLPIWGDQRYNPEARPGQPIALFAYALSFDHPTKGERMRFTALPEVSAFAPFAPALRLLAEGIGLVYEDENLLVLNKPAGLETTSASTENPDTMETRLARVYPQVYPVHRLDVNTTGLILFAKTAIARDSLEQAIRARQIRKFYRCTVKGRPEPPEALLHAWCTKAEARVLVLDAPLSGAQEMRTAYQVLKNEGDASELMVELLTGRTHQIRAHLAHIGHPILGDDRYGDRDWNREKKASLPRLCAVQLILDFPSGSPLAYLQGKSFSITPPWEPYEDSVPTRAATPTIC